MVPLDVPDRPSLRPDVRRDVVVVGVDGSAPSNRQLTNTLPPPCGIATTPRPRNSICRCANAVCVKSKQTASAMNPTTFTAR